MQEEKWDALKKDNERLKIIKECAGNESNDCTKVRSISFGLSKETVLRRRNKHSPCHFFKELGDNDVPFSILRYFKEIYDSTSKFSHD